MSRLLMPNIFFDKGKMIILSNF